MTTTRLGVVNPTPSATQCRQLPPYCKQYVLAENALCGYTRRCRLGLQQPCVSRYSDRIIALSSPMITSLVLSSVIWAQSQKLQRLQPN